ncbi:MAG: DNA mismatch repair protein MutL, partial [Bacilli bacterium]|nr:DNA mismatch repair protein MutL [Bacilli bacterium]
ALPSIASVSEVTLKTSNEETGTELCISGGKVLSIEPSELRHGTSILVKNLFYNTPVRLKYLKNLYTELSYITEYVHKMALSYPNIKFVLTNNQKVLLNTDGSNRLLKVINDIYGLSMTKKMIEVKGENADYEISGYISYPEIQKNNRNAITLLINGRYIKNNEINRIITDSYHTYMPPDKYPIVVLKIDVDPILIDVNVHPTKMDIKFSKMDTLKELIEQVITRELERLTLIPDASLETIVENEKIMISTNYSPKVKEEFDAEKKEQEFETFEKMKLELESVTPYEVEEKSLSLKPELENKDLEVIEKKEASEQKKPRIKHMDPVGLVHGTYVIAENEDGMFLIDQHAANERINYEYYLEQLSNPKPIQMDLLIPITLEFPTNEYIILKKNFETLSKMGFIFEEFGLQTIVIRSIPIWIPKGNEERAIQKIIEIIIEKESFDMEKFVHKVAATVACKASIKANDHIMKEDMEVLLERLRNCENPFTCPHGRPTIITYSKYDLEKLFKRSM